MQGTHVQLPSGSEDLTQLAVMLGRLEGKMDAVVTSQAGYHETAKGLEVRVTALEHARTKVRGMVVAASAIATAAQMVIVAFWDQLLAAITAH